MKVGFATLYDARDVNRGSGTFYHLSREIGRQGHEVTYFSAESVNDPPATRLFRFASRALGKKYRSFQDPFKARRIGKKLSCALAASECDVLLTNDYGMAGYVETTKPVFIYTDAVFPFDYATNDHPWLCNLSGISVKCCQTVTRQGLSRVDFAFFPTQWAVDEVLKYGVLSKERTMVIPFGANVEDPGIAPASTRSVWQFGDKGVLKLLFVGKDWSLKGGNIAIQAVDELIRRRIPSILHLVGCQPPREDQRPYVSVHGFLNPTEERDRRKLDSLYREADFLLFPSACEGFGITVVEAAAYGIPALGYRTRGASTVVKDGETGVLIELGESGISFAERIISLTADVSAYQRLSIGARRYFEEKANWGTAVARLLSQIMLSVAKV